MSESLSQVLWAFGFAGLGVLRSREIDPSLSEGRSWLAAASARNAPPYHGTSQATGGRQCQRIWLVSAVFGDSAFCRQLPPVATAGLHKGSIRAGVAPSTFDEVGLPRACDLSPQRTSARAGLAIAKVRSIEARPMTDQRHRHSSWAASARLLVSRAFSVPSPTRGSRVSRWRTGAPRVTRSANGLKLHAASSASSARLKRPIRNENSAVLKSAL